MNAKKLIAILAIAVPAAIAPTYAADSACRISRSAPADHLGSVPILLGLDSVRKELKITTSQADRLDIVRADFKSGARKLTAQAPMSPTARRSAAAALAKLKTKANADALAVLTPTQRCRLAQIEYQVLGGTMLLSHSVQKTLKLSVSQIAVIGKLENKGIAYAGSVNQRFEDGKISHHERLILLRTNRTKQAEAMIRLLSPAQRQALMTLCGNPVKKN